MAALYVDGCDVCFDPATAWNVRANLGARDGVTFVLRPGDCRALGPGEVLDGSGCLALPSLVDAATVATGLGAGVVGYRPGNRPPAVCPMLADLARRRGEAAALAAAAAVAGWQRAGTLVLAGTPGGGGDLVEELEWLARGGLTPGQCIAAATTASAVAIGDGRPADWLLVPGGALARLQALRRPRHVVLGGRVATGIQGQEA